MRFYKTLAFAIFIITLLGLSSCHKDGFLSDESMLSVNPFQEENDKIEKGVSLDQESVTVELGETLTLTPTFGDGQSPLKYYSWEIDDESVARIDAVNEKDYSVSVVGVNKGTTTITLSSDDRLINTSCTLTVEDPFDDGIMRVLIIGNNSPYDSIELYLYHIARATDKKMVIGSLYLEGASLSDHWDNASGNKTNYEFRLIDQAGSMTSTSNTSIEEAVTSDGWNFISFQQDQANAGLEDTYNTSFPLLFDFVEEHAINYKVKFLIEQNWAYQKGVSIPDFSNYGNDQMTMYQAIVSAVDHAAEQKPIDRIIPSGTAIQNGRATILGDHFTNGGAQLNSLGQYTVACTWYESIFNEPIVGNSFRPTELDAKEIEIAQHVAHAAVETLGAVTILEDYKPVRGILLAPVLIGFGSENLPNYPKWNAFTGADHAEAGNKIGDLIDSDRQQTGIPVEIIKGFNGRNDNGKGNVSVFGINIPNDVALHSYYGNSRDVWLGKIVEESKLRISKLDRNLEYDLCFYASRNGVGDNRETKYICEGDNTVTAYLDASNNGTNISCAEGIRPNMNGEIVVTITSGEHNNNGTGFYYINAMKISKSN